MITCISLETIPQLHSLCRVRLAITCKPPMQTQTHCHRMQQQKPQISYTKPKKCLRTFTDDQYERFSTRFGKKMKTNFIINKRGTRKCFTMRNTLAHLFAILTTYLYLLVIIANRECNASGVFELEFLKLQQIADNARAASADFGLSTNASEQSTKHQQPDTANLVNVLVCLKEAFTSQLDGPCTFGNASITLHRDSLQFVEPNQSRSSGTVGKQQLESQFATNRQQQGSQLTNIVRILFTFRWTKSFTIILTAEQPPEGSEQALQENPAPANQQPADQQRRAVLSLSAASRQLNGTTTSATAAAAAAAAGSHVDPLSSNYNRLAPPRANGNARQPFIDRHVLTENEVLPNLEPNLNKPWANRFSRSLKSSLAYRFRVYCSLNYYGDGCTAFCRARDDIFGHYNCSSTGQKVCLEGWQGPDCDKPKCRLGCNLQRGYCERPDTCQCRPGWSGPRCDECVTYPGCKNGYCLSPWQCTCHRNWGGVLCDQDLNMCGTSEPCKNNGTCQNIAPGKYKCNCPEGFAGPDCGTNLSALPTDSRNIIQLSISCALNPCLNGGTCLNFTEISPAADSVSSSVNFNSPLDSLQSSNDDSSSLEQIIASTMSTSDRYHRCHCAAGWSGDYCQWPDSSTFSPIDLLPNITAILRNTTATSSSSLSTNTTNLEASAPDEQPKDDGLQSTSPEPYQTAQDDDSHTHGPTTRVDMKHLISGVVVASIVGVFLASLLLAWCCLLAIERNRFSFIQMNIIRGTDNGEAGQSTAVTATFRRVHEKIRNSLRRSTRIKPETKLSIENVLRPPKPPPTYEESSGYHQNHLMPIISSESSNSSKPYVSKISLNIDDPHVVVSEQESSKITSENLVIRGALEHKIIITNCLAHSQSTCPWPHKIVPDITLAR